MKEIHKTSIGQLIIIGIGTASFLILAIIFINVDGYEYKKISYVICFIFSSLTFLRAERSYVEICSDSIRIRNFIKVREIYRNDISSINRKYGIVYAELVNGERINLLSYGSKKLYTSLKKWQSIT